MAITEKSRHQMFNRLEKVLGHEEATVLMEHLPPVGWADVATKRDLEIFEARFDAKLDRELRIQATRFIGWMLVLFTVFTTVQSTVLVALLR